MTESPRPDSQAPVSRESWRRRISAAWETRVRTYRRRVAELMTALGAESRFQAGVRARELGLI